MDRDAGIGRKLASLRGDVSQAELAERMKELGFKWSQSTVWSIERGDRPLRYSEAMALDSALNPFVSTRLQWPEPMVEVFEAMAVVTRANARVLESLRALEEAQLRLADITASFDADQLGRLAGDVEGWMQHGIQDIARERAEEKQAEATEQREHDEAMGMPEPIANSNPLIATLASTWRRHGQRSEEA